VVTSQRINETDGETTSLLKARFKEFVQASCAPGDKSLAGATDRMGCLWYIQNILSVLLSFQVLWCILKQTLGRRKTGYVLKDHFEFGRW
jgi:hypothetical protein